MIEAVVSVLLKAEDEGYLAAPKDKGGAIEMAHFVQRRLRSQKRRKVAEEKKIRDLSIALARDFHKCDMKLIGPTIYDYDYISKICLEAVAAFED